MTKAELVKVIAEQSELNREQAKDAVETFMTIVKIAVMNGESIYLRGFGTFSPKKRKPKAARNISTGERIDLPERHIPHFKPCKTFKIMVK